MSDHAPDNPYIGPSMLRWPRALVGAFTIAAIHDRGKMFEKSGNAREIPPEEYTGNPCERATRSARTTARHTLRADDCRLLGSHTPRDRAVQRRASASAGSTSRHWTRQEQENVSFNSVAGAELRAARTPSAQLETLMRFSDSLL